MWIADAHRDDGKRFVVRADDKLRGRNVVKNTENFAPSRQTERAKEQFRN
jgi:hypothetical protein